jgi:ABC-type glutathione transport system ATPase component
VLEIRNLTVSYVGGNQVLCNLNLTLESGEAVGLTGPSGSGKSTVAYSILQLLPPHCSFSGSIRFNGMELVGQKQSALRKLRGKSIAAVPQQPAIALHPLIPVGRQIENVLRSHSLYTSGSRRSVIKLMERLGLSGESFHRYPNQLSGGQLQRAALAQALICGPQLLIADEPFAALDGVTQSEVCELLRSIKNFQFTLLLMSHDVGALSSLTDRVMILREGIAETVA